jgi:carbon-monoxide dehydrogenase medium subunit
MQAFEYKKVYGLQEAIDAISSGEATAFLAGGTDLLVQIKQGRKLPKQVIDLKGIRELGGPAEVSENRCRLGALTTIRNIETAFPVLEKLPLLAQAASKIGSVQVRHRATVGGNLCNASPSADMAPALLALDAQAMIFGKEGPRSMELTSFFTKPGKTALKDGELLVALEMPMPARACGSVYYKLSTRNAMDLAFVGVAVLIEVDGEGRVAKARIALGAVAPTPIRALPAEKRLEGGLLDVEAARESAELAAKCCDPISDVRASAQYRREMVRALCEQGVLLAYRRARLGREDKSR